MRLVWEQTGEGRSHGLLRQPPASVMPFHREAFPGSDEHREPPGFSGGGCSAQRWSYRWAGPEFIPAEYVRWGVLEEGRRAGMGRCKTGQDAKVRGAGVRLPGAGGVGSVWVTSEEAQAGSSHWILTPSATDASEIQCLWGAFAFLQNHQQEKWSRAGAIWRKKMNFPSKLVLLRYNTNIYIYIYIFIHIYVIFLLTCNIYLKYIIIYF